MVHWNKLAASVAQIAVALVLLNVAGFITFGPPDGSTTPGGARLSVIQHSLSATADVPIVPAVDSGRFGYKAPLALNHLDGKSYPHHPVILALGVGPYPYDKHHITEWNGLKVPASFDCNIFFKTDERWTKFDLVQQNNSIDCTSWNCSCQEISDKYDVWPRHWGTDESKIVPGAKRWWVESKCRTQPHRLGPPPPPPPTMPVDANRFKRNGNWGSFGYFFDVPSRWAMCYNHLSDFKSGSTLINVPLPVIDDEYNEMVALYQSVLRAKKRFVVAELGCRWGTWGTRTIQYARQARPELEHDMLLIESESVHCEGAARVMEVNNITGKLLCDVGKEKDVREWAATVPHIDVIDIDIQKAEGTLVPQLMDLFNEKVYRVIIGTHTAEIHEQLVALFKAQGWYFIGEIPRNNLSRPGVEKYLRVQSRDDPQWAWPVSHPNFANWSALLDVKPKQWHTVGGKGPVANMDGEIIVDNPRFVNKDRLFSLEDTELKIDDLK